MESSPEQRDRVVARMDRIGEQIRAASVTSGHVATLDGYRSSFTRWGERAGVRVKPVAGFTDGDSYGEVFFPPELAPASAHPLLVGQCGPRGVDLFLLRQLYNYLYFTVDLELAAIVPVTSLISRGRSGVPLPEAALADAFKITTDEAWHAQVSYDLVCDLERRTGVPRLSLGASSLLRRLDEVRASMDPDLRGVGDMLFAVVSETLISSLLRDLPKDTRLPVPVREVVADHAEDEGRHHAYFREFLRHLWTVLGPAERRAAGILVPELISVFLEPDFEFVAANLLACGLTQDAASQVITESYPVADVRREIATASRTSVNYFAELGAFDDPPVSEAFERAGLRQ